MSLCQAIGVGPIIRPPWWQERDLLITDVGWGEFEKLSYKFRYSLRQSVRLGRPHDDRFLSCHIMRWEPDGQKV